MDLASFMNWIGRMSTGCLITLKLFIITICFSIILGLILTFLYTSKNVILNKIVGFYILLFRGTPLLLQIFFVWFGLPFIPVIGQYLTLPDRFTAGAVAFILNYAAYFAEIFRYAKRSGGDVIGIIKQTSHIIHEKAEVQQQIDTIITGKRLEQRVMVCMPLVITLYLRLTSPEYIDVLYGNVMGIIVMTICLLIYAAAVMLAQKITDINI